MSALHLPPPLAALLVQRGFDDPDAVKRFLRPALDRLSDPYELAGMADAVALLCDAIRRGDRILVHGDYDVDGQCAAAVITRVLRMAGAKVDAFLPDRMADGYDLGAAGLQEAIRTGARLLLTCDCGITAVAAVRQARALGMRVIVTDHHLPGPELPPADAVINPHRPDDRSALKDLCGTGVVFKLVQALVPALGLPAALPHHFLDYVALATVADVVPLVGENRVLVKFGLRVLQQTRWIGLRALLSAAGLDGRDLRAGQLGFVLGPRLNAVGRIANANDGLRLLLTDDPAEAEMLANRLESLNRDRREIDQRILAQAIERIEREYSDPGAHAALVLEGADWHAGVVGIVASRVVEHFGRPTFLIAANEEHARGSGRSIDGFDLHAGLHHCADLLLRFGGHRMAAGLTIHRNQIDAFRDRLNQLAQRSLSPGDLGPSQRVDLEITLDQITEELERWGRHLEPCGMGNPAVVFAVRNVELADQRRVGGNHVKGVFAADAHRIEAIAFDCADRVPAELSRVNVTFRLERNEWNGRSVLQARALTLAPADA